MISKVAVMIQVLLIASKINITIYNKKKTSISQNMKIKFLTP